MLPRFADGFWRRAEGAVVEIDSAWRERPVVFHLRPGGIIGGTHAMNACYSARGGANLIFSTSLTSWPSDVMVPETAVMASMTYSYLRLKSQSSSTSAEAARLPGPTIPAM